MVVDPFTMYPKTQVTVKISWNWSKEEDNTLPYFILGMGHVTSEKKSYWFKKKKIVSMIKKCSHLINWKTRIHSHHAGTLCSCCSLFCKCISEYISRKWQCKKNHQTVLPGQTNLAIYTYLYTRELRLSIGLWTDKTRLVLLLTGTRRYRCS